MKIKIIFMIKFPIFYFFIDSYIIDSLLIRGFHKVITMLELSLSGYLYRLTDYRK